MMGAPYRNDGAVTIVGAAVLVGKTSALDGAVTLSSLSRSITVVVETGGCLFCLMLA